MLLAFLLSHRRGLPDNQIKEKQEHGGAEESTGDSTEERADVIEHQTGTRKPGRPRVAALMAPLTHSPHTHQTNPKNSDERNASPSRSSRRVCALAAARRQKWLSSSLSALKRAAATRRFNAEFRPSSASTNSSSTAQKNQNSKINHPAKIWNFLRFPVVSVAMATWFLEECKLTRCYALHHF